MNKEISELEWLACQYVLGELSNEQVEQFELQLATDEAACSALAAAVKLMQNTVSAIQPLATVTVKDKRPAPFVWWSAVAAACLFCLLTFNSFLSAPNVPRLAKPNSNSGGAAAELAIAWSETPDLDLATEPEDLTDEHDQEVVESDADLEPSWVMVAISGIEMHHDELD